jgi:hypothetical protein
MACVRRRGGIVIDILATFWGTPSEQGWTNFLGGPVQTLEGISGLTILGIVLRRVNCHADGCWRIGRHHVEGTHFITCRAHHPTHGSSVADIHAAHTAHLNTVQAAVDAATAAAVAAGAAAGAKAGAAAGSAAGASSPGPDAPPGPGTA